MQISFPMSKYSKKRREGVEPRTLGHKNLLPKVLCDPVCNVIPSTCRYVSVHHPIDYNMSMNDPREIQKRLFKYFVPVLLLSVAFNLPKVKK